MILVLQNALIQRRPCLTSNVLLVRRSQRNSRPAPPPPAAVLLVDKPCDRQQTVTRDHIEDQQAKNAVLSSAGRLVALCARFTHSIVEAVALRTSHEDTGRESRNADEMIIPGQCSAAAPW